MLRKYFTYLTEHAVARAQLRCGLTPVALTQQVRQALVERRYHDEHTGDRVVPVDGPLGPGAAVLVRRDVGWDVTTVRDCTACTQGERTEPLRVKLGELCGAHR